MRLTQISVLLMLVAVTAYGSFNLGMYYAWLRRPRVIRVFFGAAAEVPEEEIVQLFQEKTGIRVEATFGGSGTLLATMKIAKIGDLYAPGSPDYMTRAIEDGVVYADTIRIIAYMVPAIIVPKGNPKNITCLEDLAKPSVRIGIGDPKSVCVGEYAVDLLKRNHLWEAVEPNIVVYVDSCSRVAALPVIGSVDAVIGWHVFHYWNPNSTEIVWIKPEVIPKIAYIPAAICRYTEERELTQQFLNFLVSNEAQAVFKEYHYFATVEETKPYAPNAEVPPVQG